MTRTGRSALALAGLVALLGAPASAPAQMGMGMSGSAMGQPLPDSSLPTGTATVRVVRGSFLQPLVDVQVTVTSEKGTSRVARTDSEGRATLAGLAPGVQYVASVTVDKKTVSTQPFVVPEEGGVRLALSPVPWTGGGHGGGHGSGGQSLTQLAGRPQIIDSLAPRMLLVQVVAGDLEHPVAKVDVHLVGYYADGKVTVATEQTGDDGRVNFRRLIPRAVAYYALATVRRPGGDDRLQSLPIVISDTAGTSLVLVGKSQDSPGTADDLDRLYDDQLPPPDGPGPGQVVVRLVGLPEVIGPIQSAQAFAVDKQSEIAEIPLASAPAPVSTIRARATRTMQTQRPAGTMTVSVIHSDDTSPMGGIPVEVMKEGHDVVASGTSAADGLVEFPGLDVTASYRIAVTVRGKRITTGTVTLPGNAGLMVPIAVTWGPDQPTGRIGELSWGPDRVYVVRVATQDGREHYSTPFQLTSARGAEVTIPVTTTPTFRFSLGGGLDDDLMRFQGMFFLRNDSFSPFALGGGVKIPLPRGFVGAGVAEQQQTQIDVVPGSGFVYRGPLPPGGVDFTGGFALPVDAGELDFDLPLPYGADRSNVRFRYLPGVRATASAGARAQVVGDPSTGSQVYEVNGIDFGPGQSFSMRVSGLPHVPTWHRDVRRLMGLIVVALVIWTLVGIFGRRRSARAEPSRDRREELLDQLTDLERRQRAGNLAATRYQRERERLLTELESLYAGGDRPSA